MTLIYLVQHGEKLPDAGDPGLTAAGVTQAVRTGRWLSRSDLGAVYCSPLLRARQTAQHLAEAAGGLPVHTDDRLRERMNWDGTQTMPGFLDDWAQATRDRDFVPRTGDSSNQAAERMLSFLRERADDPAPAVVVGHGGVTVDVLRTLLGDGGVPADLLTLGVPACAITTLESLAVVGIARIDHL